MSDTLILAPMQGITDHIFRNTHHKHFGAFHEMMAPYILAHGEKAPRQNILKKIFQHQLTEFKLVPQLLGNDANAMIIFCNQLQEIGYTEVNWNLGCPYEFVTKKKRGSGLLPHPDIIKQILKDLFPQIKVDFSVKIRLGLSDQNEIYAVLDVLNHFPIKEIIIHPRTADQKYDGKVFLEEFKKYLQITKHQVVYNGDIYTKDDFLSYKNMFPTIHRWMIGRGVLINPLLPSLILEKSSKSKEERYNQFIAFYNDIYQQYKQKIRNSSRLLNRTKEIWSYQSQAFDKSEEVFNTIKNIHDVHQLEETVKSLPAQFKWLG